MIAIIEIMKWLMSQFATYNLSSTAWFNFNSINRECYKQVKKAMRSSESHEDTKALLHGLDVPRQRVCWFLFWYLSC